MLLLLHPIVFKFLTLESYSLPSLYHSYREGFLFLFIWTFQLVIFVTLMYTKIVNFLFRYLVQLNIILKSFCVLTSIGVFYFPLEMEEID